MVQITDSLPYQVELEQHRAVIESIRHSLESRGGLPEGFRVEVSVIKDDQRVSSTLINRTEVESASDRLKRYRSPEFTLALQEHMHRAVGKALTDAKEQ